MSKNKKTLSEFTRFYPPLSALIRPIFAAVRHNPADNFACSDGYWVQAPPANNRAKSP
jgi:hypothetical protein